MFGWGKKKRGPKDPKSPEPGKKTYGIPTVKFDPAEVTEDVKADLRQNIKSLKEVSANDFDMIYDVALRSMSAGRNLSMLSQALMAIDGMSKRRAGDISRLLTNKAFALIRANEQERLGLKYAIWCYSGAPCGDAEQDAAHKAADGKPYAVSKGMLLNGRWTRPGYEENCRCYSKSMIPGFDHGYTGGKPEGVVE